MAFVAAMMDCPVRPGNDEIGSSAFCGWVAPDFAVGRRRLNAGEASRDYGFHGAGKLMKRIVLAILLSALATAAPAQDFATTKPGKEAWWLRTSFNPIHTQVRGIPVAKIRKDWCKATEFTFDNIPRKLLDEDDTEKTMKQYGMSFATAGNFDRSLKSPARRN